MLKMFREITNHGGAYKKYVQVWRVSKNKEEIINILTEKINLLKK